MIPSSLGRYQIQSELGHGAMGTVYRALDPVLERTVAIKTLNPDLPDDVVAEMKVRFVREAKSAGRLNHPNIVTIYDVDVAGEVAFIAMEYLEGRSLRQLLDSGAALSLDAIADIAAQIAGALDYAGRFGVVHRDTKPANIMVSAAGYAKLTDFGLAYVHSTQMTQRGIILGSPKYMSPEQVREQPVDSRADIFSLGVVLYEMLMRKTPFERPGMTLFSLMESIVKDPVPSVSQQNPEIPAAFDAILARALAKRPEDRFQRAHQFAEALRNVMTPAASAQLTVEPTLNAENPAAPAALVQLLADLETSSRTQAPETLSASLRQGFHYLEALVHRIIQARPAFTVDLDLAYLGTLPAAALSDGSVECRTRMVEDKEVVDCVTLNYRMSSGKKARVALNQEEARLLKAQLGWAQLKFDCREIRDATGALLGEAFLIDVDLSASATLRADYEAQTVEILCENVGVLGPARYRLRSAEFDETIWEFGQLLLGFPSRFAGLRLPA
jgi:serine/threonine protein kinase